MTRLTREGTLIHGREMGDRWKRKPDLRFTSFK